MFIIITWENITLFVPFLFIHYFNHKFDNEKISISNDTVELKLKSASNCKDWHDKIFIKWRLGIQIN